MKILFSSYAYAPSIGGIETASALLAREFFAAGHEIVLVTETPVLVLSPDPFEIARNLSLARLLQLVRWSEVVFQNNISLRHLIPALLVRKPVLVVHQTWIRNIAGGIGWNDRIKRALLPRVRNVAVSQAIANDLNIGAEVIGNPYDDCIFKLIPHLARDRELLFVGRLVSDKGVDVLLRALGILRQQNISACLTLAELMNRHQVIVIPSRWPEPFGIVALEGIACGCIVVGSEQGGLSETIGNCGMTFPNGDSQELADRLRTLLSDSQMREKFWAAAPTHLERFRAQTVARRDLALLRELAV